MIDAAYIERVFGSMMQEMAPTPQQHVVKVDVSQLTPAEKDIFTRLMRKVKLNVEHR